jgi:riboflavin synthase
MFTGLVEEIGRVQSVRATGEYRLLTVAATHVLDGTRPGDSIAIDGACQTVTSVQAGQFTVEVLAATLHKTTLGTLRGGRRVNLERALTPQSRLGGHFVQGHIDATAVVAAVQEEEKNVYLTVTLPEHLRLYCIPEGSVAIDGVSLTIAAMTDTDITINVIPTTWRDTVLADRRVGDAANIEIDVLARYVARMLAGTAQVPTLATAPATAHAVPALATAHEPPASAKAGSLTEAGLRRLGY